MTLKSPKDPTWDETVQEIQQLFADLASRTGRIEDLCRQARRLLAAKESAAGVVPDPGTGASDQVAAAAPADGGDDRG